VYSYLYHFALALFLLGLSSIALLSSNTLKMPMLPWTGTELTWWLLWGSVIGIVSVVLAVTGIFRYLFPLWSLIVLVLMVRGYLIQPYTFAGQDAFESTLWLLGGALLAFFASLTLFRIRPRRA
jgi:hypothetical protein